jgi:omega-6 fatty acid desaturase (delta-12 desaturase)
MWALMYWSLSVSYFLTLALALPTAFMMIRLFIIQHDCGHGSFLKSPRVTDTIGAFLGVLTLTPYSYWRKTHAVHHATSGNLEHRGFGDIDTITVAEYRALSPFKRFRYRVYRHPLVLFGIGAILHFLIAHRLPVIVPKHWKRERASILWTDVGLATFFTLGGLTIGFGEFFSIWLPYTLIACPIGVWLFYVQHQFEPTYWEHDPNWQYDLAALEGSSYYALPRWLQWLTGHIGLHHVHHLNPRIPNYRLQEALDAHPDLQRVTRLTFRESLKCVSLALWDEEQRRLVPFPS